MLEVICKWLANREKENEKTTIRGEKIVRCKLNWFFSMIAQIIAKKIDLKEHLEQLDDIAGIF